MNERIAIDPDICGGRPVVRGTRITVQTVLEFLAAGDSIDELLTSYPALTRDDVLACLNQAHPTLATVSSLRAQQMDIDGDSGTPSEIVLERARAALIGRPKSN